MGSYTQNGHAARGLLIVLEGLDRSGKTTQARLLFEHFKRLGLDTRIQCFPGLCFQIFLLIGRK